MTRKQSHAADLLGLSRLTISAVVGATELAEAVHLNILNKAVGIRAVKPIAGATALLYRGVRGVAKLVGGGIDALLTRLIPLLGEQSTWPGRDALLSAVNGVLGDHLAAVDNPLAIAMTLRRDGVPIALERAALKGAIPAITGKILVLVHGLCMSDLQWLRDGHDHGAALQKDKDYTALYLHYNSGRHISTNGCEFSAQLETLIDQWPVPVQELVIVGHSMGGLVARSAYHCAAQAGHRWPDQLSKMVFLGTPHHGAPLERGGNWFHIITDLSSYTAPFSRLGKIRSAGITDLRHGSVLDQDWEGKDRFAHGAARHPLPLPDKVQCFALAATRGSNPGAAGDLRDRLAGDGLVPLASALGQHPDPALQLNFDPNQQWIGYQMNHLDLLNHPQVYQQLLCWL